MAQTKSVHTLERARDAFVDIREALENKTGSSLDNVVVEDYDDIIANIPSGGEPVLQSKTVRASQSAQYVNADAGYDGLETVTIEAVGSDIDSDIKPENIKSGINILGVIGEYSGGSTVLVEKDIVPSTSSQVITPETGVDGFNRINVGAVENVRPEIIKKNEVICGVVGTFEAGGNFKGWIKEGNVLATSPVTTQCRSLVVNDEGIFIVGNKYLYKYDEVTDSYIQIANNNWFRPQSDDSQYNVINFASGNKDKIYGIYKNASGGSSGIVWSYDDLHGLVGNGSWQSIQGYMSDTVCNDNSMYMYDRNNKYLLRYDIIANEHTTVEQVMKSTLGNSDYRPLEIFNGDIYTFDRTKLYRFNLSNNTFEEVGAIPDFKTEDSNESYASLLAFDDKLYIIGGKAPYDTYVRVYDGTTINSLGSKIPSCMRSRVKYYNGDVYMLGSGNNYTSLYKIYTSGKALSIKPSNENVTYKDDIGFNIVNVKAVKSVGYSANKKIDSIVDADFRTITTIAEASYTTAVVLNDVVHIYNKNKHYIFDTDTETLTNEETIDILDDAFVEVTPELDDEGNYYLWGKSSTAIAGYYTLAKFDGNNHTLIGNTDKPRGSLLYKDGLLYVDRGSQYYTINVTDGTKSAEFPKDSSIGWKYHFKLNGHIYVLKNGSNKLLELDINSMTTTDVLTLPYTSDKSTMYVDKESGWVYTALVDDSVYKAKLVRFKVTGEIEIISEYALQSSFSSDYQYNDTFIANNKVWCLYKYMVQTASVLNKGANIIAVPKLATRVYEGCTEEDVKVTEYGNLVILRIPEDANYLVYDDSNVYGFNVLNNNVLTAEGIKLNGVEQSGGLVDVSSLDYYIMEV